jgi:hypothetical protein
MALNNGARAPIGDRIEDVLSPEEIAVLEAAQNDEEANALLKAWACAHSDSAESC